MDSSIRGDKILIILFPTMVLSLIIGFILSLLIGPITRNTKYSSYGIGFHGLAIQSGVLILIRQGERLINYMKESNNAIKQTFQVVDTDQNNSNSINHIQNIINRMENRSIIVFLAGTPPGLFLMLAGAEIIPMYWFFPYISGFGAAFASIGSTILFLPHGVSLFQCFPKKIKNSQLPNQSSKETISSPSTFGQLNPHITLRLYSLSDDKYINSKQTDSMVEQTVSA